MKRARRYCGRRYVPGLLRHKYNLHFWMYFIAIVIGCFWVCGMPAHASLGYYELPDFYQDITNEVDEINKMIKSAFDFTQVSPYTVLNSAPASLQDAAKKIQTASKTAGLAVASLLLMVEFFRKSINFEWASKWENVLIFLIKVLVVKQIIQNTDTIMAYLYAGFNSINTAVTGDTFKFLPDGDVRHWIVQIPYRGDTVVEWVYQKAGLGAEVDYDYRISVDAVRMFFGIDASGTYFYPDHAVFKLSEMSIDPPTSGAAFTPSLAKLELMPYFVVMKIFAVAIYVITIGRIFELCIYTMLAPLPLSTFASEVSHDVGRNFLKNYIAVVIQIVIIVTMFICYSAVTTYLTGMGSMKTLYVHIITLCALGLGVVKSGTWSKRICGIS